jgi:preprotein translocase subunit SecA
LANVAELHGGIHWFSRGGRDPLYEFLIGEREIYAISYDHVFEEVVKAFATADRIGVLQFANSARFERGATWTYITSDQPFGTMGERIMKGLLKKNPHSPKLREHQ